MKRAKTAERWRCWLGEQRRSGLSVAEFCRRKAVSQNSFYRWRRKLEGEPAEESPTEAFVPLAVLGGSSVEIELPGGAVIRVPSGDTASLGQVVGLLLASERERLA